ncbi:MAG TPA: alpha/beta hydrolase [Rhodocyclaceae bacterium]|nr:alpha/beta hydrolase [Rhodocyclaceae bacterium]HRQ48053.1 alpha/beta hydrolase [Rhodocyclaceae bacterium]
MPLTSQAIALLDMVYRVGAPRFHELSVAQARRSFEKLQFAFRPDAPSVASTVDIPIQRDDASVLFGRLYRPACCEPRDRLPLLIYFHGGGWCVGNVDSYDVLCRELANGGTCAVLSIDYRLAPEHPFPAALVDASTTVSWVLEHAEDLAIDPERIALGGDSAGGTLALVTTLERRRKGTDLPKFLLLIYPCTDIASERRSRKRYEEGYLLDRASLEWFFSKYLPDGDVGDWRVSPIQADSLAGLPPIMLVMAECDPLTDDCVAFAERVRCEGGKVDEVCVGGMIHGFLTLGKFFPEASRTIDVISLRLRHELAGTDAMRVTCEQGI